jgi:hypothetical protein
MQKIRILRHFRFLKILFAFCENFANPKRALQCDANANFAKIWERRILFQCIWEAKKYLAQFGTK